MSEVKKFRVVKEYDVTRGRYFYSVERFDYLFKIFGWHIGGYWRYVDGSISSHQSSTEACMKRLLEDKGEAKVILAEYEIK